MAPDPVRGVLGLLNAAALLIFQRAVARSFGRETGNWYLLLQSCQFHIIYYASRTLPNMFAFGLSMRNCHSSLHMRMADFGYVI